VKNRHVRALDLFARQYDYGRGEAHARKVADLATSLFDQLEHAGLVPGLTYADRCAVYAASLLCDVGCAERARMEAGVPPSWAREGPISNGYQWISYELTRRWLETSPDTGAEYALSGRGRSVLLHTILRVGSPTDVVACDEPVRDEPATRLVVGLLSIADALDSTRRGLVSGVRVVPSAGWLRILVSAPATVTAEVAAARDASGVLERALGRRVFVQEIVRDGDAAGRPSQ
jgi:hypothetical protein